MNQLNFDSILSSVFAELNIFICASVPLKINFSGAVSMNKNGGGRFYIRQIASYNIS